MPSASRRSTAHPSYNNQGLRLEGRGHIRPHGSPRPKQDLESIEGVDPNVDVFGKAMYHPKTLRERSTALELKLQAKLVKPKDGVHDPVVRDRRIIDFLAVGNSLDKCFEIVPLVQKRLRRHAASPGTFSVWSTCRREKLPVKVFAGPSLWLFRERGKGGRPDPQQ